MENENTTDSGAALEQDIDDIYGVKDDEEESEDPDQTKKSAPTTQKADDAKCSG